KSVARIEKNARVGICERCAELPDLLIESHFVEIDAVNYLEPEPSQRGRHIGGVILGISKLSSKLVTGVADHQRNSLLRVRVRCRGRHQKDQRKRHPSKVPHIPHLPVQWQESMRLLTYLEAIITPWGRLRAEAAEPLRIGKRQTHPSIPSDRP